jgi:hypothetical protein
MNTQLTPHDANRSPEANGTRGTEGRPGPVDTARVALPAGGDVHVAVPAGEVRILGGDGPDVVVRSLDGEPIDEAVSIEESPQGVAIRSKDRGRRFGFIRVELGRDVRLEIQVPRHAPLRVRTASADIRATGLAGEGRWTTASGDIRLTLDGGRTTVETASGDVSIGSASALDLECRTVSGDVDVRASGSLDLSCRTVSGTISARAPRLGTLRAESTSGDVEVEGALADGEHEVGTISGSVKLSTGSPVRLEARSLTGEVDIRVPHRVVGEAGSKAIVVGSGTAVVKAHTMSGDVALHAAVPVVVPASGDRADTGPAPAIPGPTAASSGEGGGSDPREATRLTILRALERGELDVESAMRRLAAVDDAGPLAFRGFVL